MTRRLCVYCRTPLGRMARWFHIWTCRDCAARLSLGGTPRRPE